ncbi:hypothetical protein Lalb_Chr04g0251471 [Lupinus albus]|uniref:Uncharacterized protein n=1 Tax=Lupinus albus TaxID=3870 RepID=A0A6A4QNK3_LUPAL|nr:hypothetical protein Lalb_Chr04g0251471 [Lupinus albus]
MLPDFAVKAAVFSLISTLKYIVILIKVSIGTIRGIPWRQKVNNTLNYLSTKISGDFWGLMVHSVFLLLCIRPTALF